MKKSQIQMGETIVVLFIVIVIIALGLIIYFNFRSSDIESEAEEMQFGSSSMMLSILSSIPEIKCSIEAKDEECIDTTKVLVLESFMGRNTQKYRQIFGGREINLKISYPESSTQGVCTQEKYKQYNYPDNCDTYVIYKPTKTTQNKKIISTPVSIYFPDKDIYGIGSLQIITYS